MRALKKHSLAAVAAFILCTSSPAHAADDVTVLAAASLTDAFSEFAKTYEMKTGARVALAFAGSSALAKQIQNGAAADIFASADVQWMDYLDKKGLILSATRKNLLSNELVLIAPADSTVEVTIAPGFDLADALGTSRLAVADTDSVPAGIYARQALTSLGIWESVKAKLARAENVRGALAFVARGEAGLGVVYKTDAVIEPKVRIVGTFPASSHPPVLYPVALTKASVSPGAKDFLAGLEGPDAAAIFAKYGFTVLH